jgi:hypothetical protein
VKEFTLSENRLQPLFCLIGSTDDDS